MSLLKDEDARKFKFYLELDVMDSQLCFTDIIEFIKYRLNLNIVCKIGKLYMLEDSKNVQQLPKRSELDEKCNVT